MGTASSDRARMRTDLRALAKLATPEPPASTGAAPHGFATADSSGFVDLSAFSAAEDEANMDTWVERELARAGRTKAGAALSAGSMAPVAMASLLGPEPPEAEARPRKRGWAYTALGLVGVAAVAALAVTLARHAPHASRDALPPVVAAAAAGTPPVAPAAIAPDSTSSSIAVAVASAAPVAATDPAPAAVAKKHTATRWHGASAAAATPAVLAAKPAAAPVPPPPKVAAVPAAKSGGSGDALMDLMRASINSPKKLL